MDRSERRAARKGLSAQRRERSGPRYFRQIRTVLEHARPYGRDAGRERELGQAAVDENEVAQRRHALG